jgi:hypothetical protein
MYNEKKKKKLHCITCLSSASTLRFLVLFLGSVWGSCLPGALQQGLPCCPSLFHLQELLGWLSTAGQQNRKVPRLSSKSSEQVFLFGGREYGKILFGIN